MKFALFTNYTLDKNSDIRYITLFGLLSHLAFMKNKNRTLFWNKAKKGFYSKGTSSFKEMIKLSKESQNCILIYET